MLTDTLAGEGMVDWVFAEHYIICDDNTMFSENHNIIDEHQADLYQKSKVVLNGALPKHVQRDITAQEARCQCIVVGSNISTKQLERAQNINLIERFLDGLQVDVQPGMVSLDCCLG